MVIRIRERVFVKVRGYFKCYDGCEVVCCFFDFDYVCGIVVFVLFVVYDLLFVFLCCF